MVRIEDRELLDELGGSGLHEAGLHIGSDGPGEQTAAEIVARAYRELQLVHDWLGNTRAILRLLHRETDMTNRRGQSGQAGYGQSLPTERAAIPQVLDVGCGQGALLLKIRDQLGLRVIGIDLRPPPSWTPVPILTGDAVTDELPQADIGICVVMAHHLTEAQLVDMIRNVARSCRRFILLDLVRHRVPLILFRLFLSPLLCRINAQDGQTSIRKAFTAREMRYIVDRALSGLSRPIREVKHTVSPFWIRQVVDISWEPALP